MREPNADIPAAVELAARESYGRLFAWLAARWRDIAAVEDALSEAFAAALRTWPEVGVPDRPEAWLHATASRRLIDARRRRQVHQRATEALGAEADSSRSFADSAMPEPFPDERLPLLFLCAHPAIAEDARAPLMLQTVLGMDAARIAASWAVTAAAMSQRLVRAKAKIRDARLRFALPGPEEWPERVGFVLDAVYAAYGTAWDDAEISGPAGQLAREARSLSEALVNLLPNEPEGKGLLALILFCEARQPVRRDILGRYTPLSEQDPALWLRPELERAEQLLRAAFRQGRPGIYQWLAAIQSAHSQRAFGQAVDWSSIVALYDALLSRAPMLGACVGRAAALGELHGPQVALEVLEAQSGDAIDYQPYHALRAHLLLRLGRAQEASRASEAALARTKDPAVRRFLRERFSVP